MAQPPLSQQLKLMEEELGVILFERKGRMMELTQAGRSFYDYAVTLTKYMEEALMEMQSFRHGIRGKLSIGINTISDRLIPKHFSSSAPHIHRLLIKFSKMSPHNYAAFWMMAKSSSLVYACLSRPNVMKCCTCHRSRSSTFLQHRWIAQRR